ncbi:TPA: restriction endonuclease subunit S [Proteus mirabilis]|nr:restriction endonuclease subunit S [Proteus mirabilis]HEK3008977.1 restriction endonuclease subunit S [Proteus mirabilis]
MGSEVNLLTLGDVCYITDGAHSKVERQVSGVMYLTSKNIGRGQLKLDNFDFISESCFLKLFTNTRKAQRRLQAGDVLMGIIGTFGNYYLYKKTDHFGISSSIAILRAEPSKLLPEYLCYYISSNSFKNIVEKFKGGSVQGYTNISTLKALPIPVPSLDIQKKIVNNLTPIDSKISLNHQINQTLEQMAQTLFKSWFVDFDPVIDNALDADFFEQDLGFSEELLHRVEVRKAVRESDNFKPLSEDIRRLFPDAFEECAEPALGLGGWVPKRWQISTVDDELTVKGGSTPSTANPDFWKQGNIHWTSPKDLSGSQEKIMLDTERKITVLGLRKITSGLLPINTVLMSSRVPIGYLAMAKIPVAINQGYIAITTTKRLSQEYVLYWLDSSMDEIKGIAGGTTFAEISKKTFKSISMVIPDPQVIEKYTVTIKSYLNKVTLNAKERGSLEKLRDTLLPKLISGELSLSDIKIDIPEETLI